MPTNDKSSWETVEQLRSTAFILGGLLFTAAAITDVAWIIAGTERFTALVGQTFIAMGWTAALIGLVGLYPSLASRNRWLARAGVLFAIVGAITFAVMAATATAFYVGTLEGTFEAVFPVFLPGVVLGSILAFVVFGAGSLHTGTLSQTACILLLGLPMIVIVNILTPQPPILALSIDSGLALVNLAIGFTFRNGGVAARPTEPMADSTP